MKIAVLKESVVGEHRVAVSPEIIKKYCGLGIDVVIEQGCGLAAGFTDQSYQNAGASVQQAANQCAADADIILKVQVSKSDIDLMNSNKMIMGLVNPYNNTHVLNAAAQNAVTLLSLEMVPRISRAQNMDVLSSQSNLAGYRAVIEACYVYGRAMPLMMTAAGTVPPAKVLVLGAGVAGLQAIATARRMGAVVSAFDVRSAAREQVESLGAKFIAVDSAEQGDAVGGYAKEMSADYQRQQSEKIAEAVRLSDIVITTALIPGKAAPILVTQEMVEAMKPGAVIVDMATSMGGNCTLSKLDHVIEHQGIKIIGYGNLASRIAQEASQMYARNIYNLIQLMWDQQANSLKLDMNDEIVKGCVVAHAGVVDGRFQTPDLNIANVPPNQEAAIIKQSRTKKVTKESQ